MPKRSEKTEVGNSQGPVDVSLGAPERIGDEEFLAGLRSEVMRARAEAKVTVDESRQQRVDGAKRFLQDFWEIHNMFDDIGVHMTIDPAYTTFAFFEEFPKKWSFKPNYDFGSLTTVELKDRTPGWVGDTLRVWHYYTQEGKMHLRLEFEWCAGETYQRYSGWMRVITHVVLYDVPAAEVNFSHFHGVLKDVVVAWHSAHTNRDREKFLTHLKDKYPIGTTQTKSY